LVFRSSIAKYFYQIGYPVGKKKPVESLFSNAFFRYTGAPVMLHSRIFECRSHSKQNHCSTTIRPYSHVTRTKAVHSSRKLHVSKRRL
jgi:hypothetical protein